MGCKNRNSRNLADYSSQLRHFIRTNELVDEVHLDDDQPDHNFFDDSDEEELYQEEGITVSPSLFFCNK